MTFITISSVTPLMTNGENPKLGLQKINEVITPVHAMPEESNLRFNDPSLLVGSNKTTTKSNADKEKNVEKSSLGNIFLWVALATLVFETILALIIDRRRTI